jgi:hypothetical protein
MQDHDLDDFVPYSDAEMADIAAFLPEQRNIASPIATDRHANEEEADEDSELDEPDDVPTSDPRLIPPLTDFCLDDLPDDILDEFTTCKRLTNGKRQPVIGCKLPRSSRHSISGE